MDEFRDGGLHPGYAFPLWHAFLALVARLAGVDPARVVLHEASVLVPVAFLVAYESGNARLPLGVGAGSPCSPRRSALFALAAGRGGSYTALALPATASRQLLVPAVDRALLRLRRASGRGRRCATARGRVGGARARPPDLRALRR